jgi:branched-chain amino acid transport system ATP-binding protein
MQSNDPLLEARALTAFYGDFQALFDIDFRIGCNETVAIIGSNGAGKSTLLKSITGLVRTKAEAIYFDGEAIGGKPAYRIVAQGISMAPEGHCLFSFVVGGRKSFHRGVQQAPGTVESGSGRCGLSHAQGKT